MYKAPLQNFESRESITISKVPGENHRLGTSIIADLRLDRDLLTLIAPLFIHDGLLHLSLNSRMNDMIDDWSRAPLNSLQILGISFIFNTRCP